MAVQPMKTPPSGPPPNAQRRWVIASQFAMLAGLCMMALPVLGAVDIFADGGAMLLIGIWLAVSAFVVFLLMRSRARAHDLIVGVEGGVASGRLAHWTYELGAWLDHVGQDNDLERAGKWALWRVIAIFCVVIGGAFWLFDPTGGGPAVALVLLGVLAVLALVVQLGTLTAFRHHASAPGQVFIGRDGVWYNGTLHVWRGWGTRIDAVTYHTQDGSLAIRYSAPSRYGRQSHQVRIPVPSGAEDEAHAVAEVLAAEIGER